MVDKQTLTKNSTLDNLPTVDDTAEQVSALVLDQKDYEESIKISVKC